MFRCFVAEEKLQCFQCRCSSFSGKCGGCGLKCDEQLTLQIVSRTLGFIFLPTVCISIETCHAGMLH